MQGEVLPEQPEATIRVVRPFPRLTPLVRFSDIVGVEKAAEMIEQEREAKLRAHRERLRRRQAGKRPSRHVVDQQVQIEPTQPPLSLQDSEIINETVTEL